jgi:hypothetical protein
MQKIILTPKTYKKELEKIEALARDNAQITLTFEVISGKKHHTQSVKNFFTQRDTLVASGKIIPRSADEIVAEIRELRNSWD